MRAKAVIQVDQSIETVAIEPHGRRIAVTRGWGDGLVLELPSGKPAGIATDVLEASTHFAFSQPGMRLAIAGPAGVHAWDFGKESVIGTLHCGSDKHTCHPSVRPSSSVLRQAAPGALFITFNITITYRLPISLDTCSSSPFAELVQPLRVYELCLEWWFSVPCTRANGCIDPCVASFEGS